MGCNCGGGITGPLQPGNAPVAATPTPLDLTDYGAQLDLGSGGSLNYAPPSPPTVAGVAQPNDPINRLTADAQVFPAWAAQHPYRHWPAVRPGILPPAAGGMRRARRAHHRRHMHHLIMVGIALVLLIVIWG